MNYQSQNLIAELQEIIQQNCLIVQNFQEQSTAVLNQQPAPKSWSVLACIEHINRYDAFYLPRIDEKLQEAESSSAAKFKPGLIGYRFANLLHPDKNQLKTKTLPSMNPGSSSIDKTVLATFLTHQNRLLDQLESTKSVDMNQIKIKSSTTSLLRFKLGDLFRIMVFHDLRHVRQAKKALRVIKEN